MLHLRDPLRALEAVRSVTSGVFLSSEQIELWLSVLGRGRPLFQLNGSGADCQWFNFNAAGHKRMLYAAGFEGERVSKPYNVQIGRASWRESVCQYVEISVVAGSLKKKK